MRDKKSQKYTPYLNYELFVSDAYLDLKPTSRMVLHLLCLELDANSKAKRQKKYTPTYPNKSDIKLPYTEIMDRLGVQRKAVWVAFKELLEHGFISVVHHGGGSKNDPNIYAIVDLWKAWQAGDIVEEVRKSGKTGWQKAKK